MPAEKFLYFGDNLHAPYGNRSEEEIRLLACRAFGKLAKYPLKAAVIACNTVTADAAAFLRARYPFPIVGVEPAVLPAARSGAARVLVLATKATLRSTRYGALCARCGNTEIVSYAPERLAAAIEKNIFHRERLDLSKHLPRLKCGAVVLGCTHYIFFKREIEDFYGCRAYDGNVGAAERLSFLLRGGRIEGDFCQNIGTADHQSINTNICSKKSQKSSKNTPIFLGMAKNKNKKVFLTFSYTNKCS